MIKTIAIHQPNYLPWLGYFYKISNCDEFVFLDNVQYEKNGFTNRNRIKTSQGPIWLTAGVLTKGVHEQKVNDVRLNNNQPWSDKHWKTILQNYCRAPHFTDFSSQLAEVYKKQWLYLADLNETLVRLICEMLQITSVKFVKASELNVSGNGTELLVNICRAMDARAYLSGFGGAKYTDEQVFRNAGIELRYYDFKHPVYCQLWGDFVPNLSIIDLLFNEGLNSTNILREVHV